MHCGVHKHAQKTGWLHKRGGRIQTWHKRWFILTGDMLFYYKTNQDSRPTGTISLAGNNVIRHQDDPRQPNSFKFEIVAGSGRNYVSTTHDSYLISAESAEDANSWVAAIKRALHEPYGGGMFGRSLEETMQVEARLGGSYIPILVHRCAKFIIDNGLEETGIFRLPGQTSRVQALKDQYDQGSQKDIQSSEDDVHTVASLLKLYLRELPDPIIPSSLFGTCTKAMKFYERNHDEGIEEIKKMLTMLSTPHYNLLKYICRFLYMVTLHSEINKMNSVNLGTVFGPNLMSPQSSDPQLLIESSNISANFVTILIRNQDRLFPVTLDESPPKRLSIVAPMDIGNWDGFKTNSKLGGSLFLKNKSDSLRSDTRSRLGSVPAKFALPAHNDDEKIKKIKPHKILDRLDSPRRVKKTFFSAYEPSPALTMDCSSGRTSLVMISPAQFQEEDNTGNNDHSRHHIISNHSEGEEDEGERDSPTSPDILPHSSSVPLFERSTDTFSPELLVNSITKEMEGLEKQLRVLRNTLSKKKKEARLWKGRYEQERRARLAAEETIQSLQKLVDQTFQQFALDDSEEDEYYEEGSISEESLDSSVVMNENGLGSESPLPITPHPDNSYRDKLIVRHMRAQSSQ